MSSADWFTRIHEPKQARARLLCVPYAGGNGAVFRRWLGKLPTWLAITGVQLPGRAGRIQGTRSRSAHEYGESLFEAWFGAGFGSHEVPLFIYGHSMGALISYELAWRLQPCAPLQALIVSGRQGPTLPVTSTLYADTDEALRKALFSYGGTPQVVLQDEHIIRFLLPILRDDFAVTETYRNAAAPRLNVPIFVSGGSSDALVSESKLATWAEVTNRHFSVRWFPGGHFFIHEGEAAFLEYLSGILQPASLSEQAVSSSPVNAPPG